MTTQEGTTIIGTITIPPAEPVEFVTAPTNPQIEALAAILSDVFAGVTWDDSVQETARRVLAYWREFLPKDELTFSFTTFPTTSDQMVIVRDIEFASICAHHLLPFYGRAHVAYVPNRRMVGLSKIPRLVHHYARRPQTQETLTGQIAKDLGDRLECLGVAVVIESRHTCMSCRGINEHNAAMVTSHVDGMFMSSVAARQEFFELIHRPAV